MSISALYLAMPAFLAPATTPEAHNDVAGDIIRTTALLWAVICVAASTLALDALSVPPTWTRLGWEATCFLTWAAALAVVAHTSSRQTIHVVALGAFSLQVVASGILAINGGDANVLPLAHVALATATAAVMRWPWRYQAALAAVTTTSVGILQWFGAMGFSPQVLVALTATLIAGVFVSRSISHSRHLEEKQRRELAAARQQLASLNVELQQQVVTESTKVSNAAADLQRYCYSIGHDFRLPLRSIDGYLQMLAEDFGENLPPEAQNIIQHTQKSTVRLGRMIDGLLTYIRMSEGDVVPQQQDLSTLANCMATDLKRSDRSRNVTFRIAPDIKAWVGADMADKILEELMENAWKFTAKTGNAEIEVGIADSTPEGVTLFVRDNGAGFDMRHTGRLYQPFQRLHHVDDFPRQGMGLAMVRRMVERHNGRLWAEAEQGRGATFLVYLPTAVPNAEADSADATTACVECAPAPGDLPNRDISDDLEEFIGALVAGTAASDSVRNEALERGKAWFRRAASAA